MKLLLSALILAFTTINFGASTPPTDNENATKWSFPDIMEAIAAKFEFFCSLGRDEPKGKRVSFCDTPTVNVLPSDPHGTFWINKTDLVRVYRQKVQLYDQESIEFQLIDMVAAVIEMSHTIYEKMHHFVIRLDGYELCLSQTEVQIDEQTTVEFPDSKTFTSLQTNRDIFMRKSMHLLNLLNPIYRINEHLFELLNNMDKNTKIDPNLFQRMNEETIKVNSHVKSLADKINRCPMDSYVQHLSDIRMQTINLEWDRITLKQANSRLDKNMDVLRKVCSMITIHFRLAMGIDFRNLFESTAKLNDLIREALIPKPKISSLSINF